MGSNLQNKHPFAAQLFQEHNYHSKAYPRVLLRNPIRFSVPDRKHFELCYVLGQVICLHCNIIFMIIEWEYWCLTKPLPEVLWGCVAVANNFKQNVE